LEPLNTLFIVIPIVFVVGLLNFFFSGVIGTFNKRLVFIIPGIFLVVALVFLVLGLTINSSDGWAAIGYFLFFGFATIGFFATFISSLLWFFIKKPEELQ